MPISIPVAAPATYAPLSAIGFADVDSTLAPVSADRPLPVSSATVPAPPPLAASANASTTAGPFIPTSDRPVMVALSGTWTGTVNVLRSTDGGATRLPLTAAGQPWGSFTANCCEPVWQESVSGAALYLDIALSAGSLTYRVAQ